MRGALWLGLLGSVCIACSSTAGPATRSAETERPRAAEAKAGESRSEPLSAEALMADVRRLCADDFAGRGSYQEGGQAAADWVAGELSAAGLEVARQDVHGAAENIIGIKRGGERAVIVSAHFDHLGVGPGGEVFPGADDNASGAAVLLAIARAARDKRFRHTLLFISFGAEEEGLVGSGVYVRDPVWPLEKTIAVVNFDMVGRNFFEAGADRERAAAVVGLEAHEAWRAAAERAAKEAGLDLVTAPARLLELFGAHDRTDDWWFRRQGVPAIHFSTGLHDDYHEPSDTPDLLVPGQIERIARTSSELVWFLAGEKTRKDQDSE